MTWVVPKGFVIQVNQPPQFLQQMVMPQQRVVVGGPRRVIVAQPQQIVVGGPRRVVFVAPNPIVVRGPQRVVVNWCRNGPGCRFRARGICQFRH